MPLSSPEHAYPSIAALEGSRLREEAATVGTTRAIDAGDRELSALADFDTGHVLDALSFGVVVLDSELCAIYANRIAESLLAMRLIEMRGSPLPRLLPHPEFLTRTVREALENSGTADGGVVVASEFLPLPLQTVHVRVTPLRSEVTGTHLLLELDARVRG